MNLAELYFVSRKLRTWVERIVLPSELRKEIPLYEWVVLREIIETPNTTVQEIAQRFSLAQSMVSKVVMEAKEQDLLLTQVDESDRRKMRLAPSEKLIALLTPGMTLDADEILEPLWQSLSTEDQACMKRTFTLLYHLFQQQETEEESQSSSRLRRKDRKRAV